MPNIIAPAEDPVAPVALARLPQTDDELWWTVRLLFGVSIPRVSICPDHCAPFDAFAEAYFARTPVSIWKASRGYGGKSYTLALLATTEASLLGAESSVLGASAAQSLNVHEHSGGFWLSPYAPRHLLMDNPSKYETLLSNRGRIRALMASQRSVRGPHPQRLRMDEIDEMDLAILEAAQGQPMRKRGIETQTVMSSTHQYPDKTMKAMLDRAKEKGWPVREWCYRENIGTPEHPGWLTQEEVDRKKAEVPERFWLVEYELQAPSFEDRAIDTEAVEEMFGGKRPEDIEEDELWAPDSVEDEPGERLILVEAKPVATRTQYITGIDWAKSKDWTIIWTWDPTTRPWTCVAWERTNRERWPDMVAKATQRMREYPGIMVHDATGLGSVVDDLLDLPRKRNKVEGVTLAGRTREIIWQEYISAIEDGELLVEPRIEFAYHEHLYVTGEDLFKPSGHPPDSFVAGALAWYGRSFLRTTPAMPIEGITRERSPWTIPSV